MKESGRIMKLTIELVPKTSWFTNLRSILTTSQWDNIRKDCYKNANYRCEICNGVGKSHPVECHEVWSYDDVNHIQKLDGLIALCPSCHQVKHIGLAKIKGRYFEAMQHLIDINGISEYEAEELIEEAFAEYSERSRYNWTVDISYLEGAGYHIIHK